MQHAALDVVRPAMAGDRAAAQQERGAEQGGGETIDRRRHEDSG
jgi:hypothetical protein